MTIETKLKAYISYDPVTGNLSWAMPYRCKPPGTLITNNANGYIRFNFMGKVYLGHRVAWLLHTGEWPKYTIDHINGKRADNRITNLRDVEHKENIQGYRSLSPRNKTGYTGVSWNAKKNCFTATKTVDGKAKFLGCFDTAEDANQAYINADNLTPADPRKYRERRIRKLDTDLSNRFLPDGRPNPNYSKL